MTRKSIFNMSFPTVYKTLFNMSEKEGEPKAEADRACSDLWRFPAWKLYRGRHRGTPALSLLQGRSAACRWRRLRVRQ